MADTSTSPKPEGMTMKHYVSLCLRLMGIAWQIRPRAVVGFFAGALMEITGMVISIFATARLGALLAAFITSGRSDGIWLWLWVDIFAAILTAVGFFAMSYARRMLYFSYIRWTTRTFLSTLCRIDLADYYNDHTRNQINKVSGAYTWTLPQLSETILELIYGIMRFVAITVLVSQITWWLVPIIAIFLIPTLIAENRLAKVQWFVWDDKGDQRHVFWGLDWILRQAKGQMEIRTTQATGYLLRKVERLNEIFYHTQEKKYRQASQLLLPTKVIEVAGTALGSIVLLRQFLSHSISLERYFFLSGALLRIGGALNNIFGTLSRMQDALLFAGSYFSLVDSTPRLVDSPNARQLVESSVPDIEFRNVSFTYPEHDDAVFENLNLHIAAGEHVALVGENGAGKSTLIKLLLRLYRPVSGQILINGEDLNDLAIDSWYGQIATLFQDFNQYPLPIRENIQIGRSDQEPDGGLLQKAAQFGGVDKMISKYRHGWDTVLDSSFKKGVEPSGGQWQRVALARAFYRNAAVLILDEPTAAIDAKAEYDIFNNIFDHYKGKTTLIVSHRFSTVRRADRIIVLDQGKIIETGSHAELIERKGLYHEMFSKQAEGYK
jgi:ATP-binding cassette, subfamily B, bacterial